MKKLKKILFAAFTVAILSCLLCQPAFAAISESDVQAQVDAVGKEAVSGNVFIWFLCAIGFLKVGQKIDSFLSSLGVNVGHTGGSMLAEAMIAARGIGGIKNFSSHHFGGGRNSSSTNVNTNGGKGSGGFGAGFASGGLAGVVSRKVTNSAIKTATTTPGSKPSGLGSLLGDAAAGGIGGHMYASSVSKGGNFANNVIGSVATGSISQMGSISGEKAAEALHSYMGYAALESGAENVPTFQNIEIGGGRITGTELTAEHPEGISFGYVPRRPICCPGKASTPPFMPWMAQHGISSTLWMLLTNRPIWLLTVLSPSTCPLSKSCLQPRGERTRYKCQKIKKAVFPKLWRPAPPQRIPSAAQSNRKSYFLRCQRRCRRRSLRCSCRRSVGRSEAYRKNHCGSHCPAYAAGIICSHAPRSYFRRTDQCLFAI